MRKIVSAAFATTVLGACAGAPVAAAGAPQSSDGSLVFAKDVLPNSAKYPQVVDGLAWAEHVYERELRSLRARRDALRANAGAVEACSYATFELASLGGAAPAVEGDKDPLTLLRTAGSGGFQRLALAAVIGAVGYVGAVASTACVQEDPAAVEGKMRQLERAHDAMIARVRALATGAARDAVAPVESEMFAAMEGFVAWAMDLDARG